MKHLSLRLLAPIFALTLLVGTTTAKAQDLSIEAFYGHFQGSGVAENSDSLYFGVTVRDLDVRITPERTRFCRGVDQRHPRRRGPRQSRCPQTHPENVVPADQHARRL